MIASWNVNSIKARLPNILEWLARASPDVLLVQEIKCLDENFPGLELGDLGYNFMVCGQKSYNGVAILSKTPLASECRRLPGDDEDQQSRYIEAVTNTDAGVLRIASLYLPNGNPIGSDKFRYKLAWLDRLQRHARSLLALEEPTVLGGDFNVIPEEEDCHDPPSWLGDALFQPAPRAAYRRILYLGYTDAFRSLHPEPGAYTFWDYQAGAWQRDHGIRIDHLLLSPQAADLLSAAGIDKEPRAKPRASDHTPVWCRLEKAR
jgi:exodeoxyribonuclease-3